MVTNSLLDNDEITAAVQMILENEAGFSNRVQRQFDDRFGREGAKIGNSLRIRIPPRYITEDAGSGVTPQDTTETEAVVVASHQPKIGVSFTDSQLSLELNDFMEIVAKPIASQIGTTVDNLGFQQVTGYEVLSGQFAGNYTPVYNLVTPGAVNNVTGPAAWTGADFGASATDAATAVGPFNAAQAIITNEGAPMTDRFCVLSPNSQAATVPKATSLFNPSADISSQYKTGYIANYANAMFHTSPNVSTFTSGTWTNAAAVQVNTTSVEGATTLVLKGLVAASTAKRGDQLVIAGPAATLAAGVMAVNPQTRQSYRKQRVFAVVADATADGGGIMTVTVSPEIRASGAFKTVTRLPTANDRVAFLGTANTETGVDLYYHKNAFGLAIAPLPSKLAGAEVGWAAATKESDWSIRFVKQYQATAGTEVSRFDILLGWVTIRPSCAVRLQA